MRFIGPSFWAVPFAAVLAFACSSSASSPTSPESAGSTNASGSAGRASGASGNGALAAGGSGGASLAGVSGSASVSGAASVGAGAAGGSGTGVAAGGAASGGGGAAGHGGLSAGGTAGQLGASGAAGSAGSGGLGGTQAGNAPGDIASAAGTPLVAAHSMTRALYAAYAGKLFQVRRPSDGKTQDISTATAGGFVDLTALSAFCSGTTTCTVTRLYDQSGNGNDLWQTVVANQPTVEFWSSANGTRYPIVVSKGYQWLRNRTMVKKIPTGSSPQTEYFVVHGKYAGRAAGTNGCCYDYGNMETHISDDGPGTMTALYFGDATDWTRGAGAGPWVMLDMENGVFAGGGPIAILNSGQSSVNAKDPSLKYPGLNIVTGLAKTDGTKNFVLKYGNASTGPLSVAWDGSLPTNKNPTSYIPLQQQGGLSLGEGGDGSAMGTGAFSEGVVIAAQTSDATDDAIQANLTTIYQ